jgi:hypothetical protein
MESIMPNSKALEKPSPAHTVFTTGLYRIDSPAHIAAIRKGIPASMVGELSSKMGMSKSCY